MSLEIQSLPSSISVDVHHPSGRGIRGVTLTPAAFGSDAVLGDALRVLNRNIERWPVPPVTIEAVRALHGRQ